MPNLIGLHDEESVVMTPVDTWILNTIALSENPLSKNHSPTHRWITRVNWGYGSTGTIPDTLGQDTIFFQRLRFYVRDSKNCRRWVIGNEWNLSREWPDKKPIYPDRYARFYMECRRIIHELPGHEGDEVLLAATGPWNDELKYEGNPTGDWIKSYRDAIDACAGKIDGFSIHAYTHGEDPALVTSEAMMNPPFQNRYYNFRTYQDYCIAIPEPLAHLPIYLTEANQNGPWKATGTMLAMADEINSWNLEGNRKISSLIFYRYPKYDEYNIEGKPDVIKEYLATVAKGYQSPATPSNKILIPEVKKTVPTKGYVTAELLNVRNKPGTQNSQIVGSRSKGDEVVSTESVDIEGTTWLKIGSDQWVSGKFIGSEKPVVEIQDNWKRSLAFTLKWEGLWADDPNDKGKATMKGITIGTYTKWREEKGQSEPTKEELKNISDKEVEEIYFEWYWHKSGADVLVWPMCLAQFDLAVNGGVGRALEAFGINHTDFWEYMTWRRDWYRRLEQFPIFGKAWINRCKDLILIAYE